MSQRNVLESPDELQAKEVDLRELLLEFFEQHIQDCFPEADYTFDVYITTADKVTPLEAQYQHPKSSYAWDFSVDNLLLGRRHRHNAQISWSAPLDGCVSRLRVTDQLERRCGFWTSTPSAAPHHHSSLHGRSWGIA